MRQADAQLAAGARTDRHGRTRLEFLCETDSGHSLQCPGSMFRIASFI